MTTIKIFLASSEELKHERLVIAEQVANMNRTLANQDITLRLVKWEYLDSSMGVQHKQEDYNDYLVDCDMCFALFWTRFGMYTEIEFEKSLKELNSNGNIRHLSVLFKESTTKGGELRAFEKKCTEEHPTLCHTFKDDDTLKDLFNSEIERYISENAHIENEKYDEIESKSSIQTVRIFLSIDKTLEQERLELTDLVENLNHSLERRNANILMLAWDNSTNDSKDFKKEISKTDLCLNLYYTYFNNTTQAELESAYQALCQGKNPKKIYVYFKDGDTIPEKLQEFRDSFPTKYGHFYCSFSNIDTLKADFLLQFMEYQSKNLCGSKMLEVNNGKVTLDGKEYVDLKNVPFAGNNEEYNLLLKSIKKTKKLLAITDVNDEEYADYAAELQQLNEKLSKMENSLWDTALMITRLSTTKCSERLKRAMDLFNAGDNKGAQAVLNEEEIERDVEHNLHLIQLGEEGKKGLKINIEEYQLKIKTLENEMAEGWCDEVIKIRLNIVELSKKGYSEQSKETAEAYDKLGQDESDFGMYNEAKTHYATALHIRENLLYKDHPDTATSYSNMGLVYACLGDYENALEYSKKALNNREIVLGCNHHDTAVSYNNVGIVHSYMGHCKEAISFQTKALSIIENLLGIYHSDTASAYSNLGINYCHIGQNQKALDLCLKALEIRKQLFGDKHPDTSNSYGHVGYVYGLIGDNTKAMEYNTRALELCRLLFGENNIKTADKYCNVGMIHANLGNFEKAIENETKALNIRKKVLGYNHLDTANSYDNIGLYYSEIQNYQSALNFCIKALEIRKGLYGDGQCDTALSYDNIGHIHTKLGKFDQALQYQSKALELYISLLGENSIYTANSYDNVGFDYEKLGEHQKAIENKQKALDIFERILGGHHQKVMLSYSEIADYYRKIGRIRDALTAQKKLEVILNETDAEFSSLELCSRKLAVIYRTLQEYDLSIEYAQKSVTYGKKAYINAPKSLALSYICLANCQKEAGLYNDSLDSYNNALELYRADGNNEEIDITLRKIKEVEDLSMNQ